MSGMFIDVAALPSDTGGFCQLIFLFVVYGYILMYASNLISDGSELLLLVPSIAGIVGSVILPILGAVPDGCIVLFSGMGPNAQEQLNIGVGALAGSTIMLLTVPWILSVVGGRVNVVDGQAVYGKPKLTPSDNMSLFGTGVAISKAINKGAIFMIVSAMPYLVIQLPGLYYLNAPLDIQSAADQIPAKTALILCFSFLAYYLHKQYAGMDGGDSDSIVESIGISTIEAANEEAIRQAIVGGKVTLLGVMYDELVNETAFAASSSFTLSAGSNSKGNYQSINCSDKSNNKRSSLISTRSIAKLHRILRPFFNQYDRNKNGSLDVSELSGVFSDLGEDVSAKSLKDIFSSMDKNASGDIDFPEFVDGVVEYCLDHKRIFAEAAWKDPGFDDDPINADVIKISSASNNFPSRGGEKSKVAKKTGDLEDVKEEEGEEEDDDDEEEEVPEDLAHLLPDEQQRRIKLRSLWLMGIGTFLVILFSDPMVDVMSEFGNRTGVSSFYIGFLLAPLASNASEVIASYNYAQKKTQSSITIALSTLQGAAVMNNSFVMGIFMFLIVFKGLAWQFFAETASILFVQVAMVLLSMKHTHTIFDALCVVALYPTSLLLVAYLESIGWN